MPVHLVDVDYEKVTRRVTRYFSSYFKVDENYFCLKYIDDVQKYRHSLLLLVLYRSFRCSASDIQKLFPHYSFKEIELLLQFSLHKVISGEDIVLKDLKGIHEFIDKGIFCSDTTPVSSLSFELTDIDLFKYFVQYYSEVPSASLCSILGPIGFAMWLKQKNVGYRDDMMPRVITLYKVILQAVKETS